jgi:hypothetical protein
VRHRHRRSRRQDRRHDHAGKQVALHGRRQLLVQVAICDRPPPSTIACGSSVSTSVARHAQQVEVQRQRLLGQLRTGCAAPRWHAARAVAAQMAVQLAHAGPDT